MYKPAHSKEIQLRNLILNIFELDAAHKNFEDRERYLPEELWQSRNFNRDGESELSTMLRAYGIYRTTERVMAYKNIAILGKGYGDIGMAEIHIFDENTSHKILETGRGYFGDYKTYQTLQSACIMDFPITLDKIERTLRELEQSFMNLDKVASVLTVKELVEKDKLKYNLFAKFK